MKSSRDKIASNHEQHGEIEYSMIINEKFEAGNNYLHLLVNRLTDNNYGEVSEMIKIMLINRCNPNLTNEKSETPFYLFLKKLQTINDGSDLFSCFIKNPTLDLHSHSDIIGMLQEQGLIHDLELPGEAVKDVNFMTQLLEQWNEEKFINEFENFKKLSQAFKSEVSQLFEEAILRNFSKASSLLLVNGADVNEFSHASRFQMPPVFLACFYGHHEVVEVLVKDKTLRFISDELNVLHQICSTRKVHANDRQKCFDLIVTDRRCTLNIVNGFDRSGFVPLFYAAHYGHCEIAKELMRRGAYVGHDSVINNIEKDVLSEYLDECIKCSTNVRDRSCEVHVDYRLLCPPHCNENSKIEVESIHLIAENSKLKDLILHPVISSFLHIKWRKIDFIVYFNLFVYFCFMVFLGSFIIRFFHYPVGDGIDGNNTMSVASRFDFPTEAPPQVSENFNILSLLFGFGGKEKRTKRDTTENMDIFFEEHFDKHAWSYRFCVLGVALMTIYEIIQCCSSFRKYFFKLENWLDMTLLCLAYVVLVGWVRVDPENFKKVRAFTILVMAAQSIQLVSKVSFLSMSIHMAVFKRVCQTFLKTIALYSVLILAFAMSFYTLNDQNEGKMFVTDEDQSFADPFLSFITIIRMMLSDFENIKIQKNDHFQGFMFLLFVILITVILFNLLNALAISDTNEILKDAELVDIEKRISILRSYENLFAYFHLSFANVFPRMKLITITPNGDDTIKTNVNVMDCDVEIMMPDSKKIEKFDSNFITKLKFWDTNAQTMKMRGKSIENIFDFVKAQREKES